MSRFLIVATINPDKLDVLAAKRGKHYEFLIAHQGDIIFGGPARAHEGGPPEAMIIVVEAASLAAALAFIDHEPYRRNGGFSSVSVRPWSQVLPEPEPGFLALTLDADRAARRSPAAVTTELRTEGRTP